MGDPHWMTLHRLRFSQPIDARDRIFDAPDGPECCRFAPSQNIGGDGMPTWVSDIWWGLGLHDSRQAEERFVTDPNAAVSQAAEAEGAWYALLCPVAHHGAVRWRDEIETDSAVRTHPATVEGTPVVVTSAGFNAREPERIARFARGVDDVVKYYGTLDGNLRRGVFNGGFDGRDGFTVSLWRDDKEMISAAYGDGVHLRLMDRSRAEDMMDRSSFTRTRLIASIGSWDGDPLEGGA